MRLIAVRFARSKPPRHLDDHVKEADGGCRRRMPTGTETDGDTALWRGSQYSGSSQTSGFIQAADSSASPFTPLFRYRYPNANRGEPTTSHRKCCCGPSAVCARKVLCPLCPRFRETAAGALLVAFCHQANLCYDRFMETLSALDQFLDPAVGWLTAESARKLANWKVSGDLRERIEQLGHKANLGKLTEEEDAEYRAYLDDAEVISLLQAKTRRLYLGTHD